MNAKVKKNTSVMKLCAIQGRIRPCLFHFKYFVLTFGIPSFLIVLVRLLLSSIDLCVLFDIETGARQEIVRINLIDFSRLNVQERVTQIEQDSANIVHEAFTRDCLWVNLHLRTFSVQTQDMGKIGEQCVTRGGRTAHDRVGDAEHGTLDVADGRTQAVHARLDVGRVAVTRVSEKVFGHFGLPSKVSQGGQACVLGFTYRAVGIGRQTKEGAQKRDFFNSVRCSIGRIEFRQRRDLPHCM